MRVYLAANDPRIKSGKPLQCSFDGSSTSCHVSTGNTKTFLRYSDKHKFGSIGGAGGGGGGGENCAILSNFGGFGLLRQIC